MRGLRAWLRAKGLDGILILSPHNRFYLSGFLAEDMGVEESAGALLVLRNQQIIITDGRYREQAGKEAPSWEVVVHRDLARGIAKATEGLSLRRLAYEPRFTSCHTMALLKRSLPHVEWVESGDVVEARRGVKSSGEVEAIKGAIEVAEGILREVEQRLRPGMTEREVAASVVHALSTQTDGPSFPPIVASGPNAALPHATPSAREIGHGEPIIVDMGARLRGYCSDMTRTYFVGEPSGRWREIYHLVYRAQRAAIASCGPGVPCREVDRAAREIIEEAGYGNQFCHATGHGVGIAVHEAPSLSRRNRRHLRPGNVVTVEPGIYIPGEGGVRLEAMVLITKEGAVELTSSMGYLQW